MIRKHLITYISILLVIFLILGLFGCSTESPAPVEPVEVEEEPEIIIDNPEEEHSENTKNETEQDKQTQWSLSCETHYLSSGQASGSLFYEYDEYGRKVKFTNTFSGYTEEIEYDEMGRDWQHYSYLSGSLFERDENEYDENSILIRTTQYADYAGYPYTIEYKYDEEGNLIQETTISSYSEQIESTEYKYDDSGRKIEQAHTTQLQIENTTIKYNEDGSYLETLAKQGISSDRIEYIDTLYDEHDNALRVKSHYDNGHISSDVQYNYEFNEQNQLVKMVSEYSDYKTETTYEYDEYGNLIKETVYRFDQLTGDRGELGEWIEYEYLETVVPQ